MNISCSCGRVQMSLAGKPFLVSACHCDDCQEGWGRIEKLVNAPPVIGANGGTEYMFYRKNRVTFIKGKELLEAHKLKPESQNNRMVAKCCNSGMYTDHEKHWYFEIIRERCGADAPPLEMRHFTKFSPQQPFEMNDVPSYPGFPARIIFKLLLDRFTMIFQP